MANTIRKKAYLCAALFLLILFVDQWSKLWIKTHFLLNESVEICSWFHLCFVENDGMAFGMSWGNKLFLTIFRIVFSGLCVWYTIYVIRTSKNHYAYPIGMTLISAGALGNIIDCVFYGPLFGEAPWMYGKVVDMLYFPLFGGHFWHWLPWVGGQAFTFFPAIFNIADSAITVGVGILLLFYKKYEQIA